MDQDEILLDAEERMEKAVAMLQGQMQGLRTGRATAGLVDSIRVDYYGSPTPLKQIANISIPEPQQILIRPFDASSLSNIAKAIHSPQRSRPVDRAAAAIDVACEGTGGRGPHFDPQRPSRREQTRRPGSEG
jgi:ribosome recycling factor